MANTPAEQTVSAPARPEPAPSIAPTASSVPAEQTPVVETASVAAAPAPQVPDLQLPEPVAAQDQFADGVYIQIIGPTNPIPNVLSTAPETVPGPASVPVKSFADSSPAFSDDEDEEADPEVVRREQRTTSSVLATFFLVVIVLLAVASYIVY